ncbi:MAG: hypothetical protein K0S65_3200, partial [Labilithrix sp.]|nr:hypothetical protein [Labilithrix sp.]
AIAVAATARLPRDLTAEDAVTAVMCTLVDRLTAGEVHNLVLALPPSISPLFTTCVRHRIGQPTTKLDRVEFLRRVAEHLAVTPAHAELVCELVFDAVRSELPDKLVDDIAHQLPKGLQELWLSGPRLEPVPEEATLGAADARLAIEEEIERATSLPESVTSDDAFSAVMGALAARLSGGEVRELSCGLPDTLRVLFDRVCEGRREEGEVYGRDELVRRAARELHVEADVALPIVRAVFRATKRILPGKATFDVTSQLPVDIRALWEEA